MANVNRIFPENGTGFYGTVLMPRNMEHIEGVIKIRYSDWLVGVSRTCPHHYSG